MFNVLKGKKKIPSKQVNICYQVGSIEEFMILKTIFIATNALGYLLFGFSGISMDFRPVQS